MMHLDAASRSVDAALRFASFEELTAMNVSVLDALGCRIVLQTEDGRGLLAPRAPDIRECGIEGIGLRRHPMALEVAGPAA